MDISGLVVVEIKAVEALAPVHKAQLLSSLRMSGTLLGLLINFNVVHLRDGIRRVVNKLDFASSVPFASSVFNASEG
jgi:GxxExxY protein